MSKLTGLMMVMAGVGVAVYAAPDKGPTVHASGTNDSRALEASPAPKMAKALTQRILPTQAAAIDPAPAVGGRVFSAQAPLTGSTTAKKPPLRIAEARPLPEVKVEPAQPSSWFARILPLIAPAAKKVEVTPVVEDKPAAAATPTRFTKSKPKNDRARRALALDLQRELKRVGCYTGAVDGVWGTSSQAAMTRFTKQVNATLPVKDPDYILLTLVQGHIAKACTAACLNNEARAGDGSCLPGHQEASAASAPVLISPPAPARRRLKPLPGRMAIGAPSPDPVTETVNSREHIASDRAALDNHLRRSNRIFAASSPPTQIRTPKMSPSSLATDDGEDPARNASAPEANKRQAPKIEVEQTAEDRGRSLAASEERASRQARIGAEEAGVEERAARRRAAAQAEEERRARRRVARAGKYKPTYYVGAKPRARPEKVYRRKVWKRNVFRNLQDYGS